MDATEVLLTISEAVERLRAAGLFKDDHSRRSSIHALMKGGVLHDHLVATPGRQRGSKFDKRISATALEQFVTTRTARTAAPSDQTTRSAGQADGRTAVEELTARVSVLTTERQAARVATKTDLLVHENELHRLRQRILELEHQARLSEIEVMTAQEQLRDEAGLRQTFENVITQLVGPEDVGDLIGPR